MALVHWEDADHFDVLRDKINLLIDVVNGIVGVPLGAITEYYGSPADSTKWDVSGIGVAGTQYENFALCLNQALPGSLLQNFDGSLKTVAPDKRGKFPVGYNPLNPKFAAIGAEGGHEEILLTSLQSGLRDFNVGTSAGNTRIQYSGGSNGGSPNYDSSLENPSSGPINVDGVVGRIGAQDALEPHDNLPPYLTTGFIIRFK